MKDNEEKKFKGYSVNISPVLHSKIAKHIFLLQKLFPPGQTKQNWLYAAVKEKLSRDGLFQNVEKQRRVSFRMDCLTKKRLEERVNSIRPFRNSYSKKQLILEAILEKLEIEEDKAKKQYLGQRLTTISNLNDK